MGCRSAWRSQVHRGPVLGPVRCGPSRTVKLEPQPQAKREIAYDKRDAIVSFTGPLTASSYAYDANGNRTQSTQTSIASNDEDGKGKGDIVKKSINRQYSIDAASNRLQGFTQVAISSVNGSPTGSIGTVPVNYILDGNGSQTSDGLTRYQYDANGRLTEVTRGAAEDEQSTIYLHNAMGQRVFKSESVYANDGAREGVWDKDFWAWLKSIFSWWLGSSKDDKTKLGTAFVYDGANLLGEYGNGGASSKGTTEYLWLPTAQGSVLVGALVNGQPYAVHTDHLNTPRMITNRENMPVWQWAYSAFGDNEPTTLQNKFKVSSASTEKGDDSSNDPSSLAFNLRYPGQYFDRESGLHYNYLRSYNPTTGRYLQSDPIGLAGGANTYAYVGGNPLSRIDPLGLATQNDFAAAVWVLQTAYPEAFQNGAASYASEAISSVGQTNFLNQITVNSSLYGNSLTPVDSTVSSALLQTVAHELLHVNEAAMSRLLSNSFNM